VHQLPSQAGFVSNFRVSGACGWRRSADCTRGAEKAIQDLSDVSFNPFAPPALLEWARREVIQTPEFVARAAVRSLNDTDTRSYLSQIKVPTLVIAGEEDRVTPPQESETLAKGISGSSLSIISVVAPAMCRCSLPR
jgi:pimeloyl-ACP methyl ester carboxylesterase